MEDGWLCSFISLTTDTLLFEQATIEQATVTAVNNGSNIWLQVFIVLFLLFLNGFFSAAEMAVISSKDSKIRSLAEEGNRSARLLTRYIDDPGSFLSTIQVGVTFAGFLSSSVAGSSFAGRLAYLIQPTGPSELVQTLSLVLVTLLTSYVSIVIGEMVPKQIALANPEGFALNIIGLLRFVEFIFKPITCLINISTNGILKLLRIDPDANIDTATEEEIRMLLDQGKKTGSIELGESEMIVNIFEFDDKEVSEIMTHRTNVFALDIDMDLDQVLEEVINSRYSRIPVYEGDIDNIIGTLHVKDLLYYLTTNSSDHNHNEARDNFDFRKIVRSGYWVPENKRTDDLLQEMQSNHISIAVVIDEYGGTAGIVTIEDLLEEIVGNIQDEYDEEDYGIVKVGTNRYQLSAMATPDEVMRVLPQAYFHDEDEDEYDYDTIAGLILAILGRIPEEDENIEIEYKNMLLKVLSMDDKRIDRVELTITKSARKYIEEEKERAEKEKQRQEEEREKLRQELYKVDNDADDFEEEFESDFARNSRDSFDDDYEETQNNLNESSSSKDLDD